MADKSITTVRIVGRGRDTFGGDYFHVVAMLGGSETTLIFAQNEFFKTPDIVMARLGVVTSEAKNDFRKALQEAIRGMPHRFRVINEAGWHQRLFVLPNGRVFGTQQRMPVCLPELPNSARASFAEVGTLAGWQRLCRLAVGNTRMQAVLALSLSGPVITLLKTEVPMIQLVGDQNLGKSTLAWVAASVWGEPSTYARSWNATSNSVEEAALGHNASFLVLDDTSTFDWPQPKAYESFRNTVQRLAEGRTKGRLHEATPLFRVPLLSTSNESLNDMAIRERFGIDARQRPATSRLNDVGLPSNANCAFECLHGHATHPELVAELKEIIEAHHGIAGVEFIKRMQARCTKDEPGLRTWLRECRNIYIRSAMQRMGGSQRPDLARIHQKFATIYATGALAIKLGILAAFDQRELGASLLACQRSYIALIDQGPAAQDKSAALATPREALERHVREQRGLFVDLRRGLRRPGKHNHKTCEGYINEKDGELELLFANAKFVDICGGRTQANKLKRDLGDILLSGERRDAVRRAIYRNGRPEDRVHVIALRASAFDVS